MEASTRVILIKQLIRTGWNLVIFGSVLLISANVPGPVSRWAQWIGGVFFSLGFLIGLLLMRARHWKEGLAISIMSLAGGVWIWTLLWK